MTKMLLILCILYLADKSYGQISNGTDKNCTDYKNDLAYAVSNFTWCSMEYSRPIKLCESCVDSYITVLNTYHNLSTAASGSGKCIDEYVNLDRLQIVNTLYRSSYDLWNRAKCYECFQIVNGSLTHNRSEETQIFNELLNSTQECIRIAKDNATIFCSDCIDDYLQLNSYYISIIDVNEKIGICMDVVDLMNGTRSMWSKRCCEYRKNKEYIFLITTGVVTFLTVMFYVTIKLSTDIKKPEIFYQSRFAGSLTQLLSTSNES